MDKKSKQSDAAVTQAARFKQAAKEVGADESEAAFEEKLRRIATANVEKTDEDGRGGGLAKSRSKRGR